MGMVSVTLFVFFALFRPVLLYTAEEEERFNRDCMVPFSCGKLGEIKSPYTNTTRPDYCGLFVVDGCDKEVQKIQFVRGERQYEIEGIYQGDIISINDEVFNNLLETNSCESFNDLHLPKSPYFSLQIRDNLTLFKCPRDVDVESQFEFKYEACSDFRIYYNNSKVNTSLTSLPPNNCSTIQLPLPANKSNGYHDIFRLLTANFSLALTWDQCARCHFNGGKCKNIEGNFHCEPQRGSRSLRLKLGLGLGLGGPTLLIIFLAVLFVWHQRKKKKASQTLLSANPSDLSKSDLEGGNAYFGVLIFSYKELEAATNNFSSERELGDGGFGTVYFGKLRDGREVAVKRLYERNCRRVEQFINEIEILTRLHHRNLVSLYGCTSRNSRELLLVYEYIPNGTVADHLHGADQAQSDPLTWPTRMRIAIETAKALTYLHASEIIHRDVKTNNILLDNNLCVKVADFGLSRLFPNDVTHISTAPQGTPGYIDPEYYQCFQLTAKSDVYSFGVVLVELISSMPAQKKRKMATLQKFKLLATQCGVAQSPTRSPRTSPVVHLRRRNKTTLRMLLTRGSGRRSPPRREPLPSIHQQKRIVAAPIPTERKRDTLKDLFISSFDDEEGGGGGEEEQGKGFGGKCEVYRMKVNGLGGEPGSPRPGWIGFRHRSLLRRAWRPMLVTIPETE